MNEGRSFRRQLQLRGYRGYRNNPRWRRKSAGSGGAYDGVSDGSGVGAGDGGIGDRGAQYGLLSPEILREDLLCHQARAQVQMANLSTMGGVRVGACRRTRGERSDCGAELRNGSPKGKECGHQECAPLTGRLQWATSSAFAVSHSFRHRDTRGTLYKDPPQRDHCTVFGPAVRCGEIFQFLYPIQRQSGHPCHCRPRQRRTSVTRPACAGTAAWCRRTRSPRRRPIVKSSAHA